MNNKLSRIVSAADVSPPTVFLEVSGVLHPSESAYKLMRGRSPWPDGRTKYESLPVLEEALKSWPEVKVVLTAAQARADLLSSLLIDLGPSLATRVIGTTFDDLTTKVEREVTVRGGGTQRVGFSTDDYWRMDKSEVVATYVAWSRPERWVVLDDENILWPQDVRRDRLVLTDPCTGLMSAVTQDRLVTVLQMNFGCG